MSAETACLPHCEHAVDCRAPGAEVPPHAPGCCGACRAHYTPLVRARLAAAPPEAGLGSSAAALAHAEERVLAALCAVTCAVRSYGAAHVALSFNGGKDCTVVLELLAAVDARLVRALAAVVHFRPPDVLPAVDTFLTAAAARHGFALWECPCPPPPPQQQPSVPAPPVPPLAACLAATLRAFPAVRAVLLGTRNSDFPGDPRRQHASCFALTDVDRGWPRVMRVAPIVDWDHADVWRFLHAFGGRRWCALYDAGYTSLGTAADTRPNPALYDAAARRYRPAWTLADPALERESRVPATARSLPPEQGTR